VWRRGTKTVVALNFSEDPTEVTLPVRSQVTVGTDRSRDRSPVTGTVTLRPWEGVVLVETT
jgi:hypothetical protein